MKKIKKGIIYDTSVAQEIASRNNLGEYGPSGRRITSDGWYYLEETLYRNEDGEYFLYGISGPMGKYREVIDHSFYEGKAIIPLQEAAALAWLEGRELTNDGEFYDF